MRAPLFWRNVHYWLAIIVAVPLLVVVVTGLLLQVKKDVPWIQPGEQRGRQGPPQMSFDDILAICTDVPEVSIQDWNDILRVDFRPDKSLLKVTTYGGWEVQIDPTDRRVLQVAVRRSDWIESLHDGSWFGPLAKRWIFLPAGILLAVLWGTGMYLFILPQLRRLQSGGKRRPAPSVAG